MRRTNPHSRLAGALAALCLAASLSGGVAHADRRDPLANQPNIRHKVELRASRFEVAPQLVVSMNQDFKTFIGGGLALQYHLTDWLGIGLQVAGGGGLDSGLTGKLNDTLPKDMAGQPGSGEMGLQPSQQQFQSHLANINLLGSLYGAVTPVAGKLALIGSLFLHYDVYGVLGVGMLHLTNGFTGAEDAACSDLQAPSDPNRCNPHNDGWRFGLMFGAGAHLYFNQWVAFNVEIRDYVASSNPGGLDVNDDRKLNSKDESFGHNLFIGFGATFMLPFSAKISN